MGSVSGEIYCNERLKPEHTKAIQFLLQHLHNTPSIHVRDLAPTILTSNSIYMFHQAISAKSIPGGQNWRWNQTKSRKVVSVPYQNMEVTLCKLIPRRTVVGSNEKIPSLKLWLYQLTSTSSPRSRSVIWCEKGYEPEIVSMEDININDYQFLAPLMEHKVAISIWPEYPREEANRKKD